MRYFLALSLLIALCANANAGTKGRHANAWIVPAQRFPLATLLRVVRRSIVMTPFRVVCEPTATTYLPMMIRPGVVAANPRRWLASR
jgi:hypothetical protein